MQDTSEDTRNIPLRCPELGHGYDTALGTTYFLKLPLVSINFMVEKTNLERFHSQLSILVPFMDNQPPSVSTPIFPPPCPTRLDRMDVSHTQRRLGFNLQLLQGGGQLTTQ